MSTPRRRPLASTLALTLTSVLALSGCGGSDPAPPVPSARPYDAPPRAATPDSAAPSSAPTPDRPALPRLSADVAGDLQDVLDTRASALLERDRDAFLAGLAPIPGLRTTEGGYFDNLAQLPLAALSYRLVPASLVRSDDAYWGVVRVTMQLTPYDVVGVGTVDRFRFAPTRRRGYRITSTTDEAWEATHLGVQQPWDTEPVNVREGAGVLGVFDSADRQEAAGVVASVERGIADVSARVPFGEWGSHAVVYALADPGFLLGFDDLPGGDPDTLDGVAFTVPGTGRTSLASTRFALSPDLLPVAGAGRPDPELDRLVRHELVHVAVGDHDDDAPVWLSEGLAEWVSVQALAPDRREVPDRALAAARRGIDHMPSDAAFNDDDAVVHYALAWWVCEWLARTYDADAPWTVLEAFSVRAGDDQRAVVRDLLGFSVDRLARRGAELMAQTYASDAPPTSPPTSPPTAPPVGDTTGD